MDDHPIRTSNKFDEQPIGNTNKLNIDQYPPDFDPSKIQAKAEPLPIGKRLASKVFKIKKQAMEELLKIQFCQHESKIIESLSDSNPQCQILAAKVLFQYLEKEGFYENVNRQESKKCFPKMVIEKLLIIQREEAQNVGMDILFWLMDHQHQEFLLRQLNEYLLNKNPKIVGVTFRIIQSLVHNYGPKKLGDLEIFFKNFKLLSEPVKLTAKQQMIQLFQELFKWMGDNVFNSFVIHRECKDEVMKWSKSYQMQPMEIKRGLKKGQAARKVIPNEDDQEQNSTPVDVLTPYDSKWVDTILAMEKWQEKKNHLDDFIKKTNVRVIVPRENTHYITLLKRLFQDNNINLLLCGYKIVKNLSRGLKKAFSITCKSVLPYIYLRLKDNKALIVDETLATLKAMTASITIEDLEKEILEAFKDKSPQMRLNTLKLLKEFSSKRESKTSKILKSMLPTIVSLTNDSSSDVRDVALSVLCKIKQSHGMVFFEDKLESLPAKKIGIIRATPSAGIPENEVKPEMEQNSLSNFQKSNSNTSQAYSKNTSSNNRENKVVQENKNMHQQKKKPNAHPQPQMANNKNQPRQPQKSLDKKPVYTMDTKENNYQREMVNLPLPAIYEENHYHENNNNAAQRQMMQIRNEEWPIVPKKQHVRRLMILFDKLGEPFTTLATPFRLTVKDLEVLENADTSFMIDNADLLLKWALWKIQTENQEVIDKITSVVIHLIYLLKTKMTDSLTVLIMSIISNLLESEFTKLDMLQCINTSIMEISEFLREKVFNFWLTTLNESSNNPEFCDKILILLQKIFTTIDIEVNEYIAMARVEPIVRSKFFMAFLQTKKPREFLKVSGFKLIDDFRPESQWVLRLSELDFAIDVRVEERIYFFDIFRKMSHEATEEFMKIEETCPSEQIINVHIKIMDSVMLAFLDQSIQSINMHNYLSHLTGTLISLDEKFIIPNLKNLLRFLMFFLVDVSSSRLEDKDQLTRTTNKVILIVLDKIAADYLLQTMGFLLNYCHKHNLTRKLSQLLTKCMVRTTKGASFGNKALKNVKTMFNSVISFIEEFKIQDSDPIMKNFVQIFTNMMTLYKELCYQNVIEKLQYFDRTYNGSFACQTILDMFNRFMNKPEQTQKQEDMQNGNSMIQNNIINTQVNGRVMENNSFMSNLPQNYHMHNNQQIQPIFNPQSNTVIHETTNIPRKDAQMKSLANNNDLLANQGPKIRQDRRRIQNYTGLCQSYIELTRMKDHFSTTSVNNNDPSSMGQNNENEQNI